MLNYFCVVEYMPQRYYQFEWPIDENIAVDFFVLDTTPVHDANENTAAQTTWLREQLRQSAARWKIVVGHHPILSGGRHGPSQAVACHLIPLFEEFDVDLYISGHDHDLRLLDSNRGWWQLVTGAGSKLRSVSWIDATLFAKAIPGFAWIVITADKMEIGMMAWDGHRSTHIVRKSPRPTRFLSTVLPSRRN